MRVLIVDSGYVGLCMGVVFAKSHDVTLVDIDQAKVDMINRAESPIYEKDIDTLLSAGISKGSLVAKNTDAEFQPHDVVLIAVGTPSSDDGSVNLDYLKSAVDWIFSREAQLCNSDFCVICIKSTVLPGTTTEIVQKQIDARNLGSRIASVFNPEFLREGNAIYDSINPDRIVIGSDNQRATQLIQSLYESTIESDTVFVEMSKESSELCKYVSNCFLATKISFANEIANIAERIPNADIDEVMHAVGLDGRISPKFFGSGAGYGGSCFPKDTIGLISFAENILKTDSRIIRAANEVNKTRPDRLVDLLLECVPNIKGKKVAILGLAFKPDTDDTRYSPSYRIIDLLQSQHAEVWIHDPMMKKILENEDPPKNVTIAYTIEECLTDTDACILVTDWSDYKNAGLASLVAPMRTKIFIDGRRLFVKDEYTQNINYRTIGVLTKCSSIDN